MNRSPRKRKAVARIRYLKNGVNVVYKKRIICRLRGVGAIEGAEAFLRGFNGAK